MTSAVPSPASSSSGSRAIAWILLLLQMGAVTAWFGCAGKLRPQLAPDSSGYVDFPWHAPRQALGNLRTPAYPAFLKLAGLFAADLRAVPAGQMLLYFAATGLLFASLRQASGSTGLSLAASSGLLYANILHGNVSTVATDTLAAAAGIAACAMTVRFLSRHTISSAAGITIAATAGWLIRPAYLFLVVLCPLLAALIFRCRRECLPSPAGRIGSALRVLLLTTAPLLLYCGLRWAAVGQFGVVSFGGYNLVGISGQLLTESDPGRLPEDLRPIAEMVLQQRSTPSNKMVSPYDSEPPLHYLRLETRYDHTIWNEFTPAAKKIAGDDAALINPLLRNLGGTLVRHHPREYAVWIAKASRQAVKKLAWDFLDNPVGLGTTLLAAAALAIVCGLRGRSSSWTVESEWSGLRILTITAITYAATNLAVVIPVCPPLGRFTDAAGVFAGSLSMGGLYLLGRALIRKAEPSCPSDAGAEGVS